MSIPPTPPLSRGRSGPTGFPSPRCLPCPPAPARHLMMPCYTFGHASSFFHVPSPDAPRGLCVFHVFALANTRTRLSQSPYPPPSRGRSGPTGFPSPRCLPCPPAPARHLMMPCYTFGHASSFCHVPNPDDVRGLCVLHVFAVATGANPAFSPPSSLLFHCHVCKSCVLAPVVES